MKKHGLKTMRVLGVATALAMGVGCGAYDDSAARGPHRGAPSEPGAVAPPMAAADGGVAPPPDVDDEPAPTVNPFVDASEDPFSTFAADVDTASYDIFARHIDEGLLPPEHAMRPEEHVNFFDYAYPAPGLDALEPFAIHLDAAPHPFGRDVVQLRVGIAGQVAPPFVKEPANIVFLVDVSGSMGTEDKLPVAQTLMTEALGVLEPDDRVSIVTYAGATRVALAPTAASERRTIEAAIRGLGSGGGTNGGAGIQLAYAQAEAGWQEGGINHVMLLTDGDFNIGISDSDALVDLIEEKRETGVTLTALGFGRTNNDAMMERVSNAGNGIYSVMRSHQHAREYAAEQLLHTAHHIAKDMKIQVEFNAELVEAYRLVGYVNRAIADDQFRDDTVDAGEVGAGHQVTALYEVVLVGNEVPSPEGAPEVGVGEESTLERTVVGDELVRVSVRYKEPGASASDEAYEVRVSLQHDDLAEDAPQLIAATASGDFLWASGAALVAEHLAGSPYRIEGEVGDVADALGAHAGDDRERQRYLVRLEALEAMLPMP